MKVCGIICEYNPFHNGHAYHIEKARENGATHIVCAMSGNFVQRGDCAIADKWSRAKAAILSGADLVVEIPTPWACSSAENFARGAVKLLSSLNIDMLSFGCETDDIFLLKNAAGAVSSDKIGDLVKKSISSGYTYPDSLQKAVCDVFGKEISAVLSSPNNTLAVEYIRQKEKLNVDFELLPIKRYASLHNDSVAKNEVFASASAIRAIDDIEKIKPFVKKAMFEELKLLYANGLFPCRINNAERAVIASLRSMTLENMKEYIFDDNGLAERIYKKSRFAETFEELVKAVKVKSITEAAVRRAVIRCFLNIPKETSVSNPPYIKILAANKNGFQILKERTPCLPVITKKAEADRLSNQAKAIYYLECECTDKFSLLSKKIPGCSREQTSPIIVL